MEKCCLILMVIIALFQPLAQAAELPITVLKGQWVQGGLVIAKVSKVCSPWDLIEMRPLN